VNKEQFWKENNYVNQLKLRGGYGVTGNDNIGQFGYLSLVNGGYNYTIGNAGNVAIGNTIVRPVNKAIHWEETTMTNIGFDATLLKDFTLTAEYYVKKTSGILQQVIVPGYIGASNSPLGNVASINSGVEFELGYRKQIGDLKISANGNFSTLKNTVTSVGADRKFNDKLGHTVICIPVTRSAVGHSFNSFYGFVNEGIFQNHRN
jgi:hypothetical protein